MGIAHFLTTSEGEHLPNPRNGRKNADAVAGAQRALTAFSRVRRDKPDGQAPPGPPPRPD
jgi:putative transposase